MIMGVKTKMNQRLNKAFNYSPSTNLGIFHYLQSLDVPWQEENIETHLDFYYHLNNSGNKITSPLIDSFIDDSTHQISPENIAEIASIIFYLFGRTWARMWEIYTVEYNPIENYDMTETLEKTEETEFGKKVTRTDELTETREDDTLQTDTPTQTRTTEESVYGFNANDASPSREIEETNGGEFTSAQTGTVTTDNTGTQEIEDSGTETKDTDHTLIRHGNIGVTTSQQMIQSEIALWQWNFFKNVVFPNIDGVLTIQLY